MIQYLLQVSASGQHPDSSFWYFPVGIQLLFAILFVGVMMGVTHWLGPRRNTSDKLETFTSGIKTHGDARQPMAIKYFLVAILFVLFDVVFVLVFPDPSLSVLGLLIFGTFGMLMLNCEKTAWLTARWTRQIVAIAITFLILFELLDRFIFTIKTLHFKIL